MALASKEAIGQVRGGMPRFQPGSLPLLSYGFRPFFLGAALWAVAAMLLWIALVSGHVTFARSYGAVAWHVHEFLFGYVTAVLTGFLLTAVPGWTGRPPLRGGPLLALFLLWAAGRGAMLATDQIGVLPAAIIDGIYLPIVLAVIVREIIAGKNWRNLKVTLLVAILASANIVFQIENVTRGSTDYGLRIGCAAIVGLIVLIGGRITPTFTHNWLARQSSGKLPAPLGRFDVVAIACTGVALLAWVVAPHGTGTALLLLVAAAAQAARLARWAGERTWREPIVLVLHVGYAFVPLGALALGVSILWPETFPPAGALHAWTAGAIGTMTLAVMTRATLGHTGRAITSTPQIVAIYVAVILAALVRMAAPTLPSLYDAALVFSAGCWIVAFAIFACVFGSMLVRPRAAN